jgi:hypothetical protein
MMGLYILVLQKYICLNETVEPPTNFIFMHVHVSVLPYAVSSLPTLGFRINWLLPNFFLKEICKKSTSTILKLKQLSKEGGEGVPLLPPQLL